jgi:hypothetical protein
MSFQVGDVCIVVRTCLELSHLVGMECTIVDVLRDGFSYPYLTDVPTGDGKFYYASDNNLRKRKPPDDQKKRETDKPELGEWELCPWRPKRETA